MPAPLTIAARRAMVEQLLRQEPGISQRTIAARLGVGKDTVRRDVDAIAAEQRRRAPEPPVAEPERASEDDRLVLILDEPLRQALAVLRATRGVPDTERQNVAAARAAICAMADTFFEAQQRTQKGATP
ncbi:HTH domain-containing protein [Streptomyces murinus]|uniref:HTH domain-containing protein n=1 Tax=Streptomyces murinus TaxID=33900 RepID=UPI00117CEA63|nr:HTH domain-containing protein [Streptomyces murinus]WDO09931.1 HTH domain-containing protein [Streptomyces murinus]